MAWLGQDSPFGVGDALSTRHGSDEIANKRGALQSSFRAVLCEEQQSRAFTSRLRSPPDLDFAEQ
jgi:hypothetical protein